MFRTLCFEYRVVTVPYFLDEMRQYEAKDIVKNIMYVDKNEREIDRYKLFVAIQSNSKNKIELKDIMELPWDNVWLNKTEFKYDEKAAEELNEKATAIEDMLNNGLISFEKTDMMKSKIEQPKISNNE